MNIKKAVNKFILKTGVWIAAGFLVVLIQLVAGGAWVNVGDYILWPSMLTVVRILTSPFAIVAILIHVAVSSVFIVLAWLDLKRELKTAAESRKVVEGVTKEKKAHDETHAKFISLSASDTDTLDECQNVLEMCISDPSFMRVYKAPFNEMFSQSERFKKREASINVLLRQKFHADGLTIDIIEGNLSGMENLFRANIASVLSRLKAFDDAECEKLRQQKKGELPIRSQAAFDKRWEIYEGMASYTNYKIEENELLISKMDELLVELSKLENMDNTQAQELVSLQSIAKLIEGIKLYKHE